METQSRKCVCYVLFTEEATNKSTESLCKICAIQQNLKQRKFQNSKYELETQCLKRFGYHICDHIFTCKQSLEHRELDQSLNHKIPLFECKEC